MANYATLKAAIAAALKQNGNNEITGALLQQQLLAMVNSLGAGYQFVDVATPSTNPGTPDQNVFYFAGYSGEYTNFGKISVGDGEMAVLCFNGTWTKKTLFDSISKTIQLSGLPIWKPGYIGTDGTIHEPGNYPFIYSNPIRVYKGQTLILGVRDGNGTIGIAQTDEIGSTYTSLVNPTGTIPVLVEYKYNVSQDGFVAFSGYATDMYVQIIATPGDINAVSVLNVSQVFPTGGIDGGPAYTLQLAVEQLTDVNKDQTQILKFYDSDTVPHTYILIGVFSSGGVPNYKVLTNWVEINESCLLEMNISVLFPTGGQDGTDIYTLQSAISKIPAILQQPGGGSLLFAGFRITFRTSTGVQTWIYSNNESNRSDFLRHITVLDMWQSVGDDSASNPETVVAPTNGTYIMTNTDYWSIPDNRVNAANPLISFSIFGYSNVDCRVVIIDIDTLTIVDSIVVSLTANTLKTIYPSDFNVDINSDLRNLEIYVQKIAASDAPYTFEYDATRKMKYIPGDLSALPTLENYIPAFGIEKQKLTTGYAIKKVVSEIKNTTKEDGKNDEKIYVVYDAIRNNTDVQLTGWALSNGVFSNTGTGWDNRILINREYYHLRRKVIADFNSVANGIIYFGFLSNVNPRTVQQSLFSVNFANNTLNIHDVPNNNQISSVYESVSFVPSTYGNKYRLEMTCPERGAVKIQLFDMTAYKVLATITKTFQFQIPQWGLMFEKPFIFGSVAGFSVNCFQVLATYSPNIRLQIIGDSITQGYYATSEPKSYPGLIANEIGDSKVVRSGRSGGNIDNVLDIVASETTVLKPEYVMVTIGTNGGNTLQKLTTLINNIVAAGSKPIINHIAVMSNGNNVAVNAMIDEAIAQNTNVVRCVRMDVATSKNYNVSDGYDAAISYDGVHPNDIGHNRMYLQAKIDVPEIFG